MITVDKNIPMPVGMDGLKYPFAEMEVGDSFWHTKRTQSSAAMYAAKHKGFKYAERAEGKGFRLWRIA